MRPASNKRERDRSADSMAKWIAEVKRLRAHLCASYNDSDVGSMLSAMLRTDAEARITAADLAARINAAFAENDSESSEVMATESHEGFLDTSEWLGLDLAEMA